MVARGKGTSIVCGGGARLEFSSREGYALMVADDPRFSGVDESSENATSLPESAASFEDVIMRHAAHILHEWKARLESVRSPRRGTTQDRNPR